MNITTILKSVFFSVTVIFLFACSNQHSSGKPVLVRHTKPLDKNKGQSKVLSAQDSTSKPISDKWYGVYSFKMNEDHSDWRDMQKISLTITKDSILYHAEGYQIDQNYVLSAAEENGSLKLRYKKAMDNSESAVLNTTKDFGKVIIAGNTYKWYCPYIDISFGDGKGTAHLLSKK